MLLNHGVHLATVDDVAVDALNLLVEGGVGDRENKLGFRQVREDAIMSTSGLHPLRGPELIPSLRRHAKSGDSMIAEHARWALDQLERRADPGVG